MSRTRESTAYAQRLIKEYNHARKLLRKYLKKSHDPSDVTAMITVIIDGITAKQSKIIGYTLNSAFKAGAKEGDKIIRKARVTASAATVGFDMSKVVDTHLNKITGDTIGTIGKYNTQLSKQLILEYKALLADNALMATIAKIGWTPAIEKVLTKRGMSAEVIALIKGQTTTAKMINLLEMQGIRGGMHPQEVGRLLQPAITNYFGQGGVVINNVGKTHRVLQVDALGNHEWVRKKIVKAYKATPKSYSSLLARSSMLDAHNKGRYQTVDASGLTKGYIWTCLCDANSCITCLSMHGQKITKGEFPRAHPNCSCYARPLWKKGSGLKNRNPDFYFKQRDTAIYRKYKLQEFNSELPRGVQKLKFNSMLPEGYVGSLPGTKEMYEIRKTLLK